MYVVPAGMATAPRLMTCPVELLVMVSPVMGPTAVMMG